MVARFPEPPGDSGPETTDTGRRDEQLRATIARQAEQIEELQARVEEMASRRSLFLSASAHELKTPLTVLQVYMETLASDFANEMSEELRSFVTVCLDSVLRLRRLVLDLVDLAALDSGRARMEVEPVALADALPEAVEEMCALADRARLDLELEVAHPVVVLADPVRLRQIVRNLVDNAIESTPEGGSVTIRCAAIGTVAEITVADTGTGIPADRLDTIFEEFVRLDQGAGDGGSGLGLTICQRLAEAMDGGVRVTSSPGKGSEFVVTLPLAD